MNEDKINEHKVSVVLVFYAQHRDYISTPGLLLKIM